MKLTPKRLKWSFLDSHESILVAESALHHYSIIYDNKEKQFKITYAEKSTDESGTEFHNTSAECQEWAYNTHYKAKLLRWFDEVS